MTADLAGRFAAALVRVFGRCEVVPVDRAAVRIAAILAEVGAVSLAHSDAPEVLAALPTGRELVPHDAPRERLLAAEAGLSSAQFGIAETGTLVLTSDAERHRLVSLLPKTHIALLPRNRLVDSLGDALTALAQGGRPRARTITFVTGPSRTADIELELVVGVHGPQQLFVLILDTP